MSQSKLKVITLFTGIGAQEAALKRLNIPFEVIGISEIDKYAIQSYEAINGPTFNYGDITKIPMLDYADLWTYSFPCQDLSVAGKQAGISEGTRSGLLLHVERLLETSVAFGNQPKYLLLENVKALVSKKFKPDFDRWLQKLESLGYNNYWQVLNAKDYGVPQNRERVFVVSIRKDVDTKGYKFPEKIPLTRKLKDVLEPVVDEKYYLSQDKVDKLTNSLFNQERTRIQDANTVFQTLLARDWKDSKCVKEPLACASRGRNPDNPSDRTVGAPTEQRLEVNNTGCSNTLTTVEKDNYVLVREATKQGYAKAYEEDSINLEQPNSTTRRGRVGHQMANTLMCSCNQAVVQQLGNIVDTGSWDNPQRGRIYSPNGCSPALNTMQGGGLEPKIVCYDIPQTVTVRKHTVDLSKFIETLRTAKKKSGLSNKQISDILNQPLTMVEQWFRTDKCFSVPDKNIWYSLKNLLNLKDEYDVFVTEFEEKEGVFEKANRCYGTDGIAPTMTATSSDEKIFNGYRIRKLTPLECWRLMDFTDDEFYAAQLSGVSNSQLYKQAGNSICVCVLKAIFKELLA